MWPSVKWYRGQVKFNLLCKKWFNMTTDPWSSAVKVVCISKGQIENFTCLHSLQVHNPLTYWNWPNLNKRGITWKIEEVASLCAYTFFKEKDINGKTTGHIRMDHIITLRMCNGFKKVVLNISLRNSCGIFCRYRALNLFPFNDVFFNILECSSGVS